MNNISSSSSSSFECLPQDVKNLIFEELPDDCSIHSVNVAYRNEYIKKLTFESEQKIGLYGKSILLEGILCKRKIDDLEKDADQNNFILNGLSIFILKLRKAKKAENIVYNLFGGKKKFHELKILPWEKSMHYPLGLIRIEKISEAIMRGLDPNNNPFITMQVDYKRNREHERSKIIVFHQSTFDDRWNILEIEPNCIRQKNVLLVGNIILDPLSKKDMYPFLKDLIYGK